ncbi:MAG: FAD-dependent oxidoreductase [Thermodesulfobacteriota bacterium]
MSQNENNKQYRVAVIGSGPAGFYACEHLFKRQEHNFSIDMFDKLPTPHGLVRSGVAPDHQKIKSVTRVYDKIASNENFRFFGLVEYGKHITIDDLKRHYHIVIFATGAQTDRKMNIPGEDLDGSHTATEFVAWYNGHPDYKDYQFDLTQEKVAIVGVGNVAVDVARILCRTEEELMQTDIADYALEALKNSNVKEVYLLGRRGPAQAAFTNPEVKELGNLDDAHAITRIEEVELDEFTKELLESKEDRSLVKKIEILNAYSEEIEFQKSKKLHIRFLVSPLEIIGDQEGRVKAIKLVKNELYKTDDGTLRPRATNETEELEVGLVFRSIGYHGVPLPDVPFHEKWGVIHNEKGRVIDPETNLHVHGIYSTGWIKRGPTGVIGTNKLDSGETVECIIEDIVAGNLLSPETSEPGHISDLMNERQPQHFSYEDWLKLNELEILKGEEQGRPRVKYTSIDDMLDAVKKNGG